MRDICFVTAHASRSVLSGQQLLLGHIPTGAMSEAMVAPIQMEFGPAKTIAALRLHAAGWLVDFQLCETYRSDSYFRNVRLRFAPWPVKC